MTMNLDEEVADAANEVNVAAAELIQTGLTEDQVHKIMNLICASSIHYAVLRENHLMKNR